LVGVAFGEVLEGGAADRVEAGVEEAQGAGLHHPHVGGRVVDDRGYLLARQVHHEAQQQHLALDQRQALDEDPQVDVVDPVEGLERLLALERLVGLDDALELGGVDDLDAAELAQLVEREVLDGGEEPGAEGLTALLVAGQRPNDATKWLSRSAPALR
jgi:hypothetical protein